MKKIHGILLFCTTLVLIAGVWGGVRVYTAYQTLAAQLAPEPVVDRYGIDGTYYSPRGIVYYTYSCDRLETMFLNLFFCGNAMPKDHDFLKPSKFISVRNSQKLFFLREREETDILIAKSKEYGTQILYLKKLLNLSPAYYCSGGWQNPGRKPHDKVYPATLEDFNGSTDSSTVESIQIETYYGYNNDPAAPTRTIQNRKTIDAVYHLLLDAQYDCSDPTSCPEAMDPTALYRTLNDTGFCGVHAKITMRFANKTVMRFWYFPDTTVLFFSPIATKPMYMIYDLYPEYERNTLHFTDENFETLKSLLKIKD